MDVSIVIPAYNEERRLPTTLRHWLDFLSTQPFTWQIIVADDGSRDGTAAVAEALAADEPRLALLRLPANQGKGAAVRAGMLQATGNHIFYTDADLNVAPPTVLPFIAALRAGNDIAIGTRSARAYAATERSVSRVTAGLLIQATRRLLLLPTIRDTQCGFKAFTSSAATEVFSRATVSGFAFDIEALFIARRLGLRIKQIPVAVEYRPGSTYSVRRHLLTFLRDIVRVKRRDMRGLYRIPTRSY
jgi:dolichyl-phosphate beta-glucosyltransferase